MADATGISKSTVHRVLTAFGIQRHRQKHFKLFTDPFFAERQRIGSGRDLIRRGAWER